MMRRVVLIAAVAIALAGCATAGDKPPLCDGKHRRPANPYGSVLDAPSAAAVAPAAAAPPSPSPGCGA